MNGAILACVLPAVFLVVCYGHIVGFTLKVHFNDLHFFD